MNNISLCLLLAEITQKPENKGKIDRNRKQCDKMLKMRKFCYTECGYHISPLTFFFIDLS